MKTLYTESIQDSDINILKRGTDEQIINYLVESINNDTVDTENNWLRVTDAEL